MSSIARDTIIELLPLQKLSSSRSVFGCLSLRLAMNAPGRGNDLRPPPLPPDAQAVVLLSLSWSHLGSSTNSPDTQNLTRRSSLDGIPSFLLVSLFRFGFNGIFGFTDVTAAVHTL